MTLQKNKIKIKNTNFISRTYFFNLNVAMGLSIFLKIKAPLIFFD